MPAAFNHTTFYSNFHSHAQMSLIIPLLIAIPIATKQCTFEGVRFFFFNKTWIFHGSLWNLTPSSFQYLDGWTERELQKKSTSIEANNVNRPIERGRFWISCRRKYTRKDGWLFRCCCSIVTRQPLTPYRDPFIDIDRYHARVKPPQVIQPLQL